MITTGSMMISIKDGWVLSRKKKKVCLLALGEISKLLGRNKYYSAHRPGPSPHLGLRPPYLKLLTHTAEPISSPFRAGPGDMGAETLLCPIDIFYFCVWLVSIRSGLNNNS